MAKIKRQSASEVSRKAEKARVYSGQKPSSAGMLGGSQAEYTLQETAMNLSRGKASGVKKVVRDLVSQPTKEESKAALLMQNSRAAELSRSEARAKSAEKRGETKAEQTRIKRGMTGRASGGITGKGGKNVNPIYNTY
jgi:hypothetical protein